MNTTHLLYGTVYIMVHTVINIESLTADRPPPYVKKLLKYTKPICPKTFNFHGPGAPYFGKQLVICRVLCLQSMSPIGLL